MDTITVAVPNDLKEEMDQFPEINWSEVARQAFQQKIADLKFLRAFRSQSTITAESFSSRPFSPR